MEPLTCLSCPVCSPSALAEEEEPRETQMNQGNRNLNQWLAYDVEPVALDTTLRPAVYGNGRLQVSPDINRTCIHEAVCFGFADEGF